MNRIIALICSAVILAGPAGTTDEQAALCEAAAQAEVGTISEYYWADMGDFEITAYCGCAEVCCPAGGGLNITASGTYATEGRTIGVDASLIPLGTTILVEFENGTQREYVAEDTGSAIKGNILDLYFNSHQDALNFGRQKCRVYIKEMNDERN